MGRFFRFSSPRFQFGSRFHGSITHMKSFNARVGAWAMLPFLLLSTFAPVLSAQSNVPPLVITRPPTSMSTTSLVASATINPNGHATMGWIIWGNTTNYGQATAAQPMGTNSFFTTFYQTITVLSTGVTYSFRAVAANDQSQVVLREEEHGLLGAPGAATYSVAELTPTSARLNGNGYHNGLRTYGWFEWGPTPALGQMTPITDLGVGHNSTVYIGNNYLYGLQSSAAYYYRAVASNSVAVVYGETQSFITPDSNTCASSISPMNVNHGYGATMGYVYLGAPVGCAWTVSNTNSWITMISGGMGSSQIVYTVEANADVLPRTDRKS